MRLIWSTIGVVFALSCGAEHVAEQSCQTAQCRQDVVIAAWPRDQDAAFALLDALPDLLERLAAVARLVDLYPAQIGRLCDQLQAAEVATDAHALPTGISSMPLRPSWRWRPMHHDLFLLMLGWQHSWFEILRSSG